MLLGVLLLHGLRDHIIVTLRLGHDRPINRMRVVLLLLLIILNRTCRGVDASETTVSFEHRFPMLDRSRGLLAELETELPLVVRFIHVDR